MRATATGRWKGRTTRRGRARDPTDENVEWSITGTALPIEIQLSNQINIGVKGVPCARRFLPMSFPEASSLSPRSPSVLPLFELAQSRPHGRNIHPLTYRGTKLFMNFPSNHPPINLQPPPLKLNRPILSILQFLNSSKLSISILSHSATSRIAS